MNNFDFNDVDFEAVQAVQNGTEFNQPIDNSIIYQNPPAVQEEIETWTFDELIALDCSANWLVKDFIEHGNLGMVFGKSASGKSFMVQDLAYCIAAGLNFHGKETQQGSVLYVCGEGQSGLTKRFQALHKQYNAEIGGRFQATKISASFMDKESTEKVANKIKSMKDVKLVIIDTLHRNFGGGNENSAEDFALFLQNVDYLRSLDCAVLIVHHSGHDAQERARGSSAIRASLDVEWMVEKDANNIITVRNTKMKEHETPPSFSFKFKNIELGNDVKGTVLEPTALVTKSKSQKLNHNQHKILDELSKAMATEMAQLPPIAVTNIFKDSPHNAPKKVITIDEWRTLAYAAITIDSDSTDEIKIQKSKKEAFRIGRNKLLNAGYIGLHGDYVWWLDRAKQQGQEGN